MSNEKSKGIFEFLAIDGMLLRDRRNFYLRGIFVFVIDGILYPRDRRNFVSSRSTEFLFSRSTNQAIDESSDRRIKRSIVSITLKIRDREFSRKWNSGIPGKKRRKKKIPIPTSPKRSTKDLFKALFFYTPWSEPEEECQHQTSRR